MMEPTVFSAIVVAVGSLMVALVTQRQNRRGAAATNVLAARVVDREDFDSVMERMKDLLARSDKRITDLELRLEVEVSVREKAEERAIAAEARADAANLLVVELERRVSQLERTLREHDIPVPPII